MVLGPILLTAALFITSLLQGWVDHPRPQSVELRTGYGYARNTDKRPSGFQIHPFQVSLRMPLTEPMGPAWFRGRIEWNPELYFAILSHPVVRPILGGSPLQFRYMLEPRGDWSFYGVGGLGVVHANLERPETGSDFNFMLNAGVGALYALNENLSLILEYRRVHISNREIDRMNKGIDSNNFLAGVSWKV